MGKVAHNYVDLAGKVFGRLTVHSRADNDDDGKARFLCVCECGRQTKVRSGALKRGHTKSCGCMKRTGHLDRVLRHGHASRGASTDEYIAFNNMRARAKNLALPIDVEWRTVEGFVNWLEEVGRKPDSSRLSLRDKEAGFVRGNLYWRVYP